MSNCLNTYYKCLALEVDVPTLVRDVKKLFYSLYDKYAKFYDSSPNINFEQNKVPFNSNANYSNKKRVINCVSTSVDKQSKRGWIGLNPNSFQIKFTVNTIEKITI